MLKDRVYTCVGLNLPAVARLLVDRIIRFRVLKSTATRVLKAGVHAKLPVTLQLACAHVLSAKLAAHAEKNEFFAQRCSVRELYRARHREPGPPTPRSAAELHRDENRTAARWMTPIITLRAARPADALR